VCIDANFAQQQWHSHYPDLVDPHPNSHFVPVGEVESMKCMVEQAWPSEACVDLKGWRLLLDETLDDCEQMFVAVQGHIAKTNSTLFADTALMALLCHHDWPLFLVNMTSAGEHQYYALALIKALFQHLPGNWVVGLLYDVACQLE
jgi:Kyakuja-Dileera-Zisupton transposase